MIDFVVYSCPPKRVSEALAALAQAAGVGAHAAELSGTRPRSFARAAWSRLKRLHTAWGSRQRRSR